MNDFEKLGWFYLGRPVDPATKARGEAPLLYDSRDLVTHAAIVGMTGSGKTGLGVGLLEEAAIDGVPALVIDPKGDLSNLLLTFPELRPEDFLPWMREEEAQRRGRTREELATDRAQSWRDGLASWGQDGERIRRLRAACDVALYTPGSDLAQPISILSSFAAPPRAIVDDGDLFGDRVETAATSLLSLAGLDTDPLRSREHILVSTLLAEAWRGGRDLDLATLIAEIQKPPVTRVGVMDLEAFFPASDRFALAMRLNNLLAAPGFEVWMRGAPLAIDRLLYTDSGKPRLAVLSLAHLSDAERMFFVSLLLNETVSWIRSKSGTASLRALLYMDEVFGYLPPVAEPPSKKPMLTLLKQARAFGLGVVLATQNPVDLDYKALSNVGTWFLGRLQTERDKARVLDGLESAAAASGAGLARAEIDQLLSGLPSRVFLLHNVHEEAPVLFETRWVMSYLAGPLDREQLRRLAAEGTTASAAAGADALPRGEATAAEAPSSTAERAQGGRAGAAGRSSTQPILPPAIQQSFLPAAEDSAALLYRPVLLGFGRAFVEDARRGVSERLEIALLARLDDAGSVDWSAAERSKLVETEVAERPRPGIGFAPVPARAARPESYRGWTKDFESALARAATVRLLRSPALGELSRVGESERDFRIRLSEVARERRDEAVLKIRDKYAARIQRLEDQIRRAEEKVEVQKQQAASQKMSTVLAGAASIAGMLFGRKRVSATSVGRVGTAVRSFGRSQKEADDVRRAEGNVEKLQGDRAELTARIEEEVAAVGERLDAANETLETVEVRPRKSDLEVRRVVLAWEPRAS